MVDEYVIDSDALDLLDETASVISEAITKIAVARFAENEKVGDIYTKYVKRIDVEWASMSLLGEELWNRMMDAKEAASKRG